MSECRNVRRRDGTQSDSWLETISVYSEPRSDAWRKYATLQCSDLQKVIGIIEAGASRSKLEHSYILRARKNVADEIWDHGAIVEEDSHIK
jgi:hypothetical protein